MSADLEVNWLADWLEAVAKGEEAAPDVSFLEPNLRFELRERDGDQAHLRVYFELECRPRWAPADGASMEDLWAEVEATPAELMQAADDLRKELKLYPVRAGVVESRNRPGR